MAKIVVTCEAEVSQAVKSLSTLGREFQTLKDKGDKLTESEKNRFEYLNKEIAEQNAELIRYWRSYDVGTKSTRELSRTQKELAEILRTVDPNSEDWLELSEVYRKVKDEQDELRDKLRETGEALSDIGEEAKKSESIWKRFGEFVVPFNATLSAVSKLKGKLQELSQDYLVFSDLQSDVQKTTGLTAQEVESLAESFKKIDTRSSRDQLMELAATAGKLGISAKEDVEGFVRAADQINVALGEDLGEGAIRQIGKLSDMFGLTKDFGIEQAYLKIGSAINSLGAASTASEGYLVDFTQRMAGVAVQAGLSIDQILGYGSALDQSAMKNEMAATAFQAFITKMFSDTANSANIAGMKVEEFTDLLQNDANTAIQKVLVAMNKKGGFQELIPVFESMHLEGNRAISVLSAMATNIEAVQKAQADSNKAFVEGTSVTEEFNTKNNNAAAQVEKMQNRLTVIRQEIGQNLVPILLKVSEGFNGLLKCLVPLAKALPSTTAGLVQLALAFAGLAVARFTKLPGQIRSFSSALAAMRGGVQAATIAVKNFFKAFLNNPIGLVVFAITGLVAGIRKLTEAARESRKAFNEFYGGMTTELNKADLLFKTLKKTNAETKEYYTAKKAIIDQYGPYLQGLINEKNELTNIEEAQKRVTAAIKDRWATDALGKRTSEINEKSYKKQSAKIEKVRSLLPDTALREGQIEKLLNYQGDYQKMQTTSTGMQMAMSTMGFNSLLKSMNLPTDKAQTLSTLLQEIRDEENKRQALVKKEEVKYAPFQKDYSTKNELAEQENNLKQLEYKKANPLQFPGLNLWQLDKDIAAAKAKIKELQDLLNPAAVDSGNNENGSGTTTTILSDGDEETEDVKAEQIKEKNRLLQEAVQDTIDANSAAKKTADEKEIMAVEKKYKALINKEKAFQLEMDKIINNKKSTPEQVSAAKAAKKDSRQRELQLPVEEQKELFAILERQAEEHQKKMDDALREAQTHAAKALKEQSRVEIENIKAKYAKLLKEADDYIKALDDIIYNPNSSFEDVAAATKKRNAAVEGRGKIEASQTTEINETEKRYKENWETVQLSHYGDKKNKNANKRDKGLKDVDQWEKDAMEQARTAYDNYVMSSDVDMDAALEAWNALEETKTNITLEAEQKRQEVRDQYRANEMQNALQALQLLQQAMSSASQAMSDIKQLELDKANAQYEKDKANLDKQLKKKQISQATYNKKMEALEEEKEAKQKEIRKKYQLAEFLMQIAQIGTATALACMNAWAAYAEAPPVAAAMTAISAAMGAVQTGVAIAQYNQAKQYKTGGYTGEGGVSEPAGIVHKGEYVVPQWVLHTPKGMNYVAVLEAIRTNKTTGYAGGGYVRGASGTGSPAAPSDFAGQIITVEQGAAGRSAFTPAEAAELLQLTRSIDQKLNGVSLVYLNSHLKDLNRQYDNVKKNFGFDYPA